MAKSIRQLKGDMDTRFGGKADRSKYLSAIIGHPDGTVYVEDRAGYVWARVGGANGQIIQVYARGMLAAYNLPILIYRLPHRPRDYGIADLDINGWASTGSGESNTGGYTGAGYVQSHAEQHYFTGGDPVLTHIRAWTPLRVYVSTGFTIGVQAGIIPRAGADLQVASQTLDLTSHIPASGALYVLITVDATGALAATDGTAASGITALTMADIPDTPAGHFRLAAVRLYVGQTALQENRSVTDIVDLRWPQERLAGDVYEQFGDQAANTFLGGPQSGADAYPTFRLLYDADIPDDIARLSDIRDFTPFYPTTSTSGTPGTTWYNAAASAPAAGSVNLWTADTNPRYFICPTASPTVVRAGTWRFFGLFRDIASGTGDYLNATVTPYIRHSNATLTALGPGVAGSSWGGSGVGSYGREMYVSGTITADVTLAAGDQVVIMLSSPASGVHPLSFAGATCYVGPQTDGTPSIYIPGVAGVSLTAGQVAFGSATSTLTSSANLLYDASNIRLGVGRTPTLKLDVYGSGAVGAIIESSDNYAYLTLKGGASGNAGWSLISGFPNAGDFTIRESGVQNALTIAKTTAAATFLATVQGTRFISTIATGTAPLGITSTTLVSNLNADLLDGQHASAFIAGTPGTLTATTINAAAAPHTHEITASSDVSAGTSALLKSDASGYLMLSKLGIGASTAYGDLTVQKSSPIIGFNRTNNNSDMAVQFWPLGVLADSNLQWAMGIPGGANYFRISSFDGASDVVSYLIQRSQVNAYSTTVVNFVPTATMSFNKRGAGVAGDIGMGNIINFNCATNTTLDQPQFDITTQWLSASHGLQRAAVDFNVWDTAARSAIRLISDGAQALVGIGTTTPAVNLHVVTTLATYNAPVEVQRIEARTTGTAGAGFGPQFSMYGESNDGGAGTTYRQMGAIITPWTDASDATRTSKMDFYNVVNGVLTLQASIGAGGIVSNTVVSPFLLMGG